MLVLPGVSPGHPVIHCPTHPCCDFCLPPALRGSAYPKVPAAPSASIVGCLHHPELPEHRLKWQMLLALTKARLCHLNETRRQLRVLWRGSVPSGSWPEMDSGQVTSNLSWPELREWKGFLLPLDYSARKTLTLIGSIFW